MWVDSGACLSAKAAIHTGLGQGDEDECHHRLCLANDLDAKLGGAEGDDAGVDGAAKQLRRHWETTWTTLQR